MKPKVAPKGTLLKLRMESAEFASRPENEHRVMQQIYRQRKAARKAQAGP